MRLRVFIVAILALAAPSAWASTELSTGAAVSVAFGDEAFGTNGGDNPAWLAPAPGTQMVPYASDGSPTDDGTFTVTEALLRAAPSPAHRERYSWVIPLIAFAGLTAFFARKRSGGRGLISV
jgi:hypothetical protein